MKHILLATPYDDGEAKHSGGIALWAKNLDSYYKSLEYKNDIEVDFLPCNRNHYVSVEHSLCYRIWGGIRDYISIVSRIKKKIQSRKYDVLHFCSSASIGLFRDWIIVKVAHHFRTKIVIHYRFGRIPDLWKKQDWEWKILKSVIRSADQIIVIDNASLNVLVNDGYNNVTYIPNPLQPKTIQVIKENSEILHHDERTIVFVGHVIRSKGVFELVNACSSLKKIKLKIIGHVLQDIQSELEKEVKSYDHTWLSFLGQTSYEETIKEMLSCAVFVLPTYTEGFPNVILEAMACGCPIVTTNVGAIPEMLDIEKGESYGICIKPRDVEGLKNAIHKMLDDRIFALQCGKNARKRVNELYSMPKIWNQLVKVWENL